MKPAKIFNSIRKDRLYLLKVSLLDMVVMTGIIALFPAVKAFELTSLQTVLAVVFGVLTGWVVSSFLHNASHGNIKNPFLNRIIGEFCGFWVLYGFTNFVLIHLLHHKHSDEELDPVNPKGMGFIKFVSAPMRYMIQKAKLSLFQMHGHHSDYRAIWALQFLVLNINLGLRLVLWYTVLGRELFTLFYLPGLFSNIMLFAHINYVTHRNREDGTVEIVNINHNLYYKIINFITIGGYFHKNHHINVRAFNPMSMLAYDEGRMSVPAHHYGGSRLARYFNINNVWGEGDRNRLATGDDQSEFLLRFQSNKSHFVRKLAAN